MTLTAMQFKAGWGGGLAAAAPLIALAAIDRGLSALWPASYGLVHPRAAIAALNMPLLAGYLILRA
ncbi:hypothetical protein C6Q14_27055 [Burkholderia ambifaria]|uniref:hypothetical protein n=1 Tax=Burkholderia ambifaria TaxID=152480 RepID=UPI000D00FA2B|nr:hypothetical protein [Burkholderia ambifaria]MBR8186582.1 hypothetical protein [Burkholderia ambifaria]PRF98001.1 hypothetical protein C6Q14_27055 [Burkholderia ambifaria]